jgi:hypothetical protein
LIASGFFGPTQKSSSNRPNPSNTDIPHPFPQIGFKLLHNHHVETACDAGISDTKTTQSQRRIREEKAMIQAQKSPLGYLDKKVSPRKGPFAH